MSWFYFFGEKSFSDLPGINVNTSANALEHRVGEDDCGAYVDYGRRIFGRKQGKLWQDYFWPPGFAIVIGLILDFFGENNYPWHMIMVGVGFWALAFGIWNFAIGPRLNFFLKFLVFHTLWLSPTFRLLLYGAGALRSESISLALFAIAFGLLILSLRTHHRSALIASVLAISLAAYFRTVFDSIGIFVIGSITIFFGFFAFRRLGWKRKRYPRLSSLTLVKKVILANFLLACPGWLEHWLRNVGDGTIESVFFLLSYLSPASVARGKVSALVLAEFSLVLIIYHLGELKNKARFSLAGVGAIVVCSVIYFVPKYFFFESMAIFFVVWPDRQIVKDLWRRSFPLRSNVVLQGQAGRIFSIALLSLAVLFLLDLPWRLHHEKNGDGFQFGNHLSYLQQRFWWNPSVIDWAVTSDTPCHVDKETCSYLASHPEVATPTKKAWLGYLTLLKHPGRWFYYKAQNVDTLLFGMDYRVAFHQHFSAFFEGIFYVFFSATVTLWLAILTYREKGWRYFHRRRYNRNPDFLILLVITIAFYSQNFVLFTLSHYEFRYIFPLRLYVVILAIGIFTIRRENAQSTRPAPVIASAAKQSLAEFVKPV